MRESERHLKRGLRAVAVTRVVDEVRGAAARGGLPSDEKPFRIGLRAAREASGTATALADALISGDTQHEPVYTMLHELLEKFMQRDSRFPLQGFAIVPLGSAMHGGMKVREALNVGPRDEDDESPDVDWLIVCDRTKVDIQRAIQPLRLFLEEQVPLVAVKYGFTYGVESRAYKQKGAVNFFRKLFRLRSNVHVNFNVSSDAEARHLFSERSPAYEKVVSYFHASVPPEINQKNRAYILDALRSIACEDKDVWRMHVDNLIMAWKAVHFIKAKHLKTRSFDDVDLNERAERHEKRNYGIHYVSVDAMVTPFKQLLESTGTTGAAFS